MGTLVLSTKRWPHKVSWSMGFDSIQGGWPNLHTLNIPMYISKFETIYIKKSGANDENACSLLATYQQMGLVFGEEWEKLGNGNSIHVQWKALAH